MKKYLLYHPVAGIFLGMFGNVSLWSDLDPMGISSAFVFSSIKDLNHFAISHIPPENLEDLVYYEIKTEEDFQVIPYCEIKKYCPTLHPWNPMHSPIQIVQ